MVPDKIVILKLTDLLETITPLVFLTIDWKLIFCGDWAFKTTEVKINKPTNNNIDFLIHFCFDNSNTFPWSKFTGMAFMKLASVKCILRSIVKRRFFTFILRILKYVMPQIWKHKKEKSTFLTSNSFEFWEFKGIFLKMDLKMGEKWKSWPFYENKKIKSFWKVGLWTCHELYA